MNDGIDGGIAIEVGHRRDGSPIGGVEHLEAAVAGPRGEPKGRDGPVGGGDPRWIGSDQGRGG